MDPMPRKKTTPPPPPPDGENGEPPAEIDIAELQTALLANPASRSRLLEDMAVAHDGEGARLRGWRAQVRAWLETAIPALGEPMRRLHWLRNERNLSALETHERDQLAHWLDGVQAQIADYERAERDLTEEIKRHREAARQLRFQKGEKTVDHGNDPPQEPEETGKACGIKRTGACSSPNGYSSIVPGPM